MGLAHSPSIVTSGLMLCLDAANIKSYSGSGTTWTDLTGNGKNGTLTNGPSYTSGVGGYFSFDGTDDYVLIGTVPNTGTSTVSVSWCVWVYPTSTAGNIVSMSSVNPQGSWNMPPIAATGQKFRGKIWSNNYLFSTTTYSLSTWYHLALVFDYAATAQRFYVNGVLQDSQSGITYSSSESDNYLFLGQSNPGADNTGNFAGRMAYFSVYGGKALTDAEVQRNFNAMRGRFGV